MANLHKIPSTSGGNEGYQGYWYPSQNTNMNGYSSKEVVWGFQSNNNKLVGLISSNEEWSGGGFNRTNTSENLKTNSNNVDSIYSMSNGPYYPVSSFNLEPLKVDKSENRRKIYNKKK